ncbi:class I tRNA ligase family protein [Candidatus Carsonella ruddii]|uniref:class I tRNA ligase family protein n=1 Tax=Carsonella ruddii TaxID=114186 RepID=UPI003D521D6B
MLFFKNPFFIEKKINKKIKSFKKEKIFCLPMFPYPSGKLHLGHVRNYILTDIISKIKILEKKNVLHPIAWDSYGLPAENASINFNLSPLKWTLSNVKLMRKQLKLLQLNYNKNTEFLTCDINFYKWEFWILIYFLKNKLLFKNYDYIYWDKDQNCILSNEQINNNLCWRSNTKPIKRKFFTWFINIKKYTKRLIFNLKKINWSKKIKKIQKKWININLFFIYKNLFFIQYNKIYININFIKKIYNLKILYLIIKQKNKCIFKKKIFLYDYIFKKNKKILLTNFNYLNKKLFTKKINILINKKNIFFIKITNIKNWAFQRQRIWGSPLMIKKNKNIFFSSTSTIDTFFQSSWYYINYIKSKNLNNQFKNNWIPINVYIGGEEHANLHLLYLRIINNIFYDFKIINEKNIVLNLINQGFINNEVYLKIKKFKKKYCKKNINSIYLGVEKMSKSKKNGINPSSIILKYGSDMLKLSIITNKPINKNINWKNIDFKFLKNFILKINNYINLKIINKNEINDIKNILNIKKIHNIISYINKILKINYSIKQIENIVFWLFPIIPNISKIFWFKIGNNFPIEKYIIEKKKIFFFNIYYKKKFIKCVNILNINNLINKIYIKKIQFSMDEISILLN